MRSSARRGGPAAEVDGVVRDHADADHVGGVEVVESDQRGAAVVGRVAQGAQRADRHAVVAGEHGGRRVVRARAGRRRAGRRGTRGRRRAAPTRGVVDAGGGHARRDSRAGARTGCRRTPGCRRSRCGDAPARAAACVASNMPRRFSSTIESATRLRAGPVDRDDRRAEVALALEVGLVVGHGDEQQRGDALREQGVGDPLLALGGVVGGRDDERVPAGGELALDPGGDLVVERVAQLADDEADGVRAAAAAQAPRERVRAEPQPLGGGEHALDGLGRDEVAGGEDARDGLRAHAREARHVFERRPLLNRHRPPFRPPRLAVPTRRMAT